MAHNKRLVLSIVLLSSLVTLACSATTVEGFMCNLMGGEWVKDLDDPLAYEYYCIDPESNPISSVVDESLPEETAPQNNDGDSDIFTGTTSLNEIWQGYYSSEQTIENIVMIEVSPSGAVTGTLTFSWQGGPSSPLEWEETAGGALHSCTTETAVSITGILTGTYSETNQDIQIELTQMQDIKRFDCPSPDEVLEGTDVWNVEIVIAGDNLTGTIPGFFTFEAARQ